MGFKPTDEQQKIIDAFRSGANLVVEAGAGAGKTSTLKLCAAAAPRKRGLYLAYNRAIKEEAAAAFPAHVRAMTTHGMAYGPVATRYLGAGREINGRRIPAAEVARILGIREPIRLSRDTAPLAPQQVARIVNQVVDRFCKSGDDQVAPKHVPTLPGTEGLRDELVEAVLPYARLAWQDIMSLKGRLRFEHNHYLKIFQLSRPRLRGDVLFVDEAQDLNPCVAALVADQTHMQVIYVGDSCQAINGWNGAINAMRDVAGRRLYLTQSFRFGTAVADEANKWLEILDARLRLSGFEGVPSRLGSLSAPSAVLCRTNAGAVREVVSAQMEGRRAALVGGGTEIRALAMAALELSAGRGTSHPQLCAFHTWAEVQEYAEQDSAGSDLKVAVKLIDSHGPEKVIRILDDLVEESRAEVTVSTAHKSKGREWDTVRVSDDFPEPRPDSDGCRYPSDDEAMLAYVTVTRARRVLDRDGLAWVDEFLTPGSTAVVDGAVDAGSVPVPETPTAVPEIDFADLAEAIDRALSADPEQVARAARRASKALAIANDPAAGVHERAQARDTADRLMARYGLSRSALPGASG